MSDSILKNTKKILGIGEDYTAFDVDVLTHINSAFSTLNQLGLGPVDGFSVEDETTTWDTFLADDPKLNSVKTYVYLRVRLIFDPPATSYAIDSFKEQIKELEWRLNTNREATGWVDPDPEPTFDEESSCHFRY